MVSGQEWLQKMAVESWLQEEEKEGKNLRFQTSL